MEVGWRSIGMRKELRRRGETADPAPAMTDVSRRKGRLALPHRVDWKARAEVWKRPTTSPIRRRQAARGARLGQKGIPRTAREAALSVALVVRANRVRGYSREPVEGEASESTREQREALH